MTLIPAQRTNFNLVTGYLNLSDITDYSGYSTGQVSGVLQIISPLGIIIYEHPQWSSTPVVPYTSPNFLNGTTSIFNTALIPLDNLDKPLNGAYQVNLKEWDSVNNVLKQTARTYQFSYASPVVKIQQTYTYSSTLTSSDITRYNYGSVLPAITLDHEIKYPKGIVPAPTDIVTTLPSYIVSPIYTGTWVTIIKANLLYIVAGDFYITDFVESSQPVVVVDLSFCALACCLETLGAQYDNTTNDANKLWIEQTIAKITWKRFLFDTALNCGQTDKANQYYTDILNLANCGVCDSCDDTTPKLVVSNQPGSSTPSTGDSYRIGDYKETTRSDLQDSFLWCDGQTYNIIDFPVLYGIIGTTYNTGGEPVGTFRVPDRRGRSSIGAGQGSGLTNRVLGTRYGSESSAYTPAGSVSVSGSLIVPAVSVSVTSITGAATIGTKSLTINPITPAGTVTAPGIGTLTTAISGTTATGTTGTTALSLVGDGSTINGDFTGTPFSITYTPTGTVTAPGLGTLTTAVSGVTAVGTTGSTALTITGSGSVTSVPKTGLTATSNTCFTVSAGETTSVMQCGDLAIPSFNIVYTGVSIASALSISPNPHTHSMPSVALTLTQGLTGALAAPTFTATNSLSRTITPAGSVGIDIFDIVNAMAIAPNPHSHSIPSLGLTLTQGLTGTLSAPTFTGSPVTPSGTVVIGNPSVSGTGVGVTSAQTLTPTFTGSLSGTLVNIPILHPVLTVNVMIKAA